MDAKWKKNVGGLKYIGNYLYNKQDVWQVYCSMVCSYREFVHLTSLLQRNNNKSFTKGHHSSSPVHILTQKDPKCYFFQID